ncbi:MAG: citrate synthase [Oscillospiraceae bacterium]|nr:citrate synthase [Oscillospiraceae bacterium]
MAEKISSFVRERADALLPLVRFDRSTYDEYGVRRGLRNPDGTGVMAGLTRLGNVRGYYIQDSERVAAPGKLTYRGVDLGELARGFLSEGRPGYEETAYLLLFGELPDEKSLEEFCGILAEYRDLPPGFTEDMILAAPSRNVMNKLSRSILALYSYDPEPETSSGDMVPELKRALRLIARVPVIAASAYAAKRHYFGGESLHLRRSMPELRLAENFLHLTRGGAYTPEEARLLDLCLVLHAEHGGGNNSTFVCRAVSSSGSDIYSAAAAAVGALKGPKHGGANESAEDMLEYIGRAAGDRTDDEALKRCLSKILRMEAGSGDGKIYGMGHAIYTLSDPRAALLKETARAIAEKKGMSGELELIEAVERLTPEVFSASGHTPKTLCANVDLYSGFVYKMLGIPRDLYAPLFAVARMASLCAHRIEELWGDGWGRGRIIRPAYKAIAPEKKYVPMRERGEFAVKTL